ncbi:hypothetical protein R3P38DRAFT_3312437 [Favolaschia claudopus]|uniref:CxC6 like cysteine cluster associated with KDZ domain-containing protein n=1 Tax=Favolaschia claudopus TaxID=2862362 RepID=A0AAW0C550_9AGAR
MWRYHTTFLMWRYHAEWHSLACIQAPEHGVWAHRDIARAQENSLDCFHAGWSNWAKWFTTRQSQRLFTEHFARCLLKFHGKADSFTCNAHSATKILVEAHGCLDCTHVKCYADEQEIQNTGESHRNCGSEAGPAGPVCCLQAKNVFFTQQAPLGCTRCCSPPSNFGGEFATSAETSARQPRGYCRLSVMDGKSLTHKCGILSCGRPLQSDDSMTCDDPTHINWYNKFVDRFHRTSFPGVQRVIRRQMVELPNLGDTQEEKWLIPSRRRPLTASRLSSGLADIQSAGGKCYRSESTPQVLSLINKIWEGCPDLRPSFLAYDKACDLLRHIVTQDGSDSIWIATTRFIVDAWHYINHRTYRPWAFNTETAEQLNSWLNGFESQLRQMTDVNFDFFVHVLMMLYAERVEEHVRRKNRGLMEEFWAAVNGDLHTES